MTEYPLEHQRYDGSEYEPFWASAAAIIRPLKPLPTPEDIALKET